MCGFNQFFLFAEEDVILNNRLFRWPGDLDSVLKVSAVRFHNCRISTEKLLREKTEKFLER